MAEDGSPSGNRQPQENEENEETDQPQHLCLDLGDDLSRTLENNKLGTCSNASTSANPTENYRREDNPFSFKHFIRSDSTNINYQHKGARPKVYCENRSVSLGGDINQPATDPPQNRVPELSSALPDFVQDHLVIEQCYLGSNSYNVDVNNLPDFTNNRPNEIPFDSRLQADFPLDLPTRSCPAEVGNSKSLPDFLADSGAVCNKQIINSSPSISPVEESERLRHELEITRRQLSDQTRRGDALNRELDLMRSKEHSYTQNLAKALEQVENNLEKSKRRSASAENTIIKLRQEISSLKGQISNLKFENRSLRGDDGASASGSGSSRNYDENKRLAQELKAAANNAEMSLRQLLTGVDNLRMMASSLEHRDRIEDEKGSETFRDIEKDSGPAL